MKNLIFTYTLSMLLIGFLATGCTSTDGKMKDSSIELINEPQTPEEENTVCLAYVGNYQEEEITINE